MKKFENIIIVTDLDGTFLNDSEGLVERNVRAVEYFKSNGGLFTIATGRATEHARGAVPHIEELINFPAVTCNGACLYDFSREQAPFINQIDHERALRLVEHIHSKYPSAGIRLSTPEYCFACTPEDAKNKFISEELKKYPTSNVILPMSEWHRLTILKIVIRIDAELLDIALPELSERFSGEFEFTRSWSTIIDIQPSGINKGKTIKKYIRERFGDNATLYACGDYLNDLEMLKEADIAVCPSNAQNEVKEICDLCLCSNNEGLIADLVEYIENR